jgi:hypothetical protein
MYELTSWEINYLRDIFMYCFEMELILESEEAKVCSLMKKLGVNDIDVG